MQIREESKDNHVNIPESEHRKHEEGEVNAGIEGLIVAGSGGQSDVPTHAKAVLG